SPTTPPLINSINSVNPINPINSVNCSAHVTLQQCNNATPSAPILDFISSDESLDRYSEVISASGWKLDSYLRNPVFQNAHQYGDIIFTLGRALITEIRYSQIPHSEIRTPHLYQRIQFAVDANP